MPVQTKAGTTELERVRAKDSNHEPQKHFV